MYTKKFLLNCIVILTLGESLRSNPLDTFGFEIDQKRFPVIIPIDDPLELECIYVPLNETWVLGDFSLRDGIVTGLSELQLDLNPVTLPPFFPLKLTVLLVIPTAAIEGLYHSDITVRLWELLPSMSVEGEGSLSGSLTNLRVGVNMTITFTPRPTIVTAMSIDIDFESASVNLEGLRINGELFDFDDFNARLKEIFDEHWEFLKDYVNEFIRETASSIIQDCTAVELIGIIGGGSTECLNIPELPTRPTCTDTPTAVSTTSTTTIRPPTDSAILDVSTDLIANSGFSTSCRYIPTHNTTCPGGQLVIPAPSGNPEGFWLPNCAATSCDIKYSHRRQGATSPITSFSFKGYLSSRQFLEVWVKTANGSERKIATVAGEGQWVTRNFDVDYTSLDTDISFWLGYTDRFDFVMIDQININLAI